jgi:HK97 family phage portal protein
MATSWGALGRSLSSWFFGVRVDSVTVPAAVWGTPDAAFCGGPYAGAYASLYRTQPAVRTVLDFLAENIAQLGLHAYRWLDQTDRVRLQPTHPLSKLLRTPNGRTTRYRLIRDLVQDVGIYGNAYWVKLGPREDSVDELLRIPPTALEVIAGPDTPGLPEAYHWTWPNGGRRELAPKDVIHFRLYSPESPLVGLSPLETLRRLLGEEQAAIDYRAWFWQNGAKLSGWIGRPKDAPRWSEPQRTQFRDEWQQFHSAQHAGRTAVLEDGMEFNPVTATARDSQLIESRKLTREEVAAVYHVPPAMIGITEAQGYGSIREQHKVLYQDVLSPWLEMITTELELQLVPDFGDSADLYLEFNINAKLQGSFEEQATALNTAVGAPWMSRNEARTRQHLPRIDDPAFDQPVTRLDLAEGQQAKAGAPEEEEADAA